MGSVFPPETDSRGAGVRELGTEMDESFKRGNWRNGEWQTPFSKAEMEAARRALRDEEGLLAEVLALLRKVARNLPFSEDVLAAYHCVRDPATSTRVKLILLGALAYFVMPVDAVPDILPVLGFTDDAAVMAAAIASVRNSILPQHREMARATLDLPERDAGASA